MSELVEMFRQLHDENIAWDAFRTLDYAQEVHLEQVPLVLADNGCDHDDDESKYAKTANEALARAIIKHHPEILEDNTQELLQRRSSRLRSVIVEYLSENPPKKFPVVLRAVLKSNDDALIGSSIQGLQFAIAKQKLQVPLRDEVFDLLLPLCFPEKVFRFDAVSLLAHLDPERAKTDLVCEVMLTSENPALGAILRNACELESDVSSDSLISLFEELDGDRSGNALHPNSTLAWVVRLATRKQDPAFAPVLERASKHRNSDVKRLGLLGLIKLRLPQDPVRTSADAVDAVPTSSLSRPVKVVAFTSKYLDEVEDQTDGLLMFARMTPAKRFRYTIKSLAILKATPHVDLLTWLLEEVGENPKASLKAMRASEVKALRKSLSGKQSRLNFDRLRILLYQFILANCSAFARVK